MVPIQNRIRVLIADNHPTTRAGIRTIIGDEPNIQVVGEAEDGFQVKKMVTDLHPKVLLLDLVMPGIPPTELEKWVRTNFPETITLVLTAHDCDSYLTSMMDAGVTGFLLKTETGERLISAIRRAVNGESLFTQEQFSRVNLWRQESVQKWDHLTKRERQILRLVVEGYDNKCIAEKLGITVKTAAYHVTNVLKKLAVKSRHEAIAWAHKHLPENLELLLD